MSGSSEKLRDDGMSHKSSSSKDKLPRSKSSKSISSRSTSSKSTSSGRGSTEKLGMGGNSSDWIQYQARLRKSRQVRNGAYNRDGMDDSRSRTSKHSTASKHSTLSKHSSASGHSTASKRSTSSKFSKTPKDKNKGGTVRSEVVRGDKSSTRSTILKSKNPSNGAIDDLSDQNIKDMCNEEKLALDDVSIDVNDE